MYKVNLAAVIVLFAFALSSTGCGKGADGAVLAKVNRTAITSAEFKKQLEEMDPRMQQAVATDPKARKEFLDDLIGIECVLQEARRQGLDKDAEYKKRVDDRKRDVERRIQEEAKNDLFNSLLKKELLAKVAQPTDQEVKEYYTTHRAEIKQVAGKDLTLKQAEETGLKNYIFRKKQRDAYLEYAKTLRTKAKVVVDDKALDAAVAALSQPAAGAPGGLHLETPAAAPKGAGTK